MTEQEVTEKEFYFVRNKDAKECKTCNKVHEFWTRNCVPAVFHVAIDVAKEEDREYPDILGQPQTIGIGTASLGTP
jgi:hypothetical protein